MIARPPAQIGRRCTVGRDATIVTICACGDGDSMRSAIYAVASSGIGTARPFCQTSGSFSPLIGCPGSTWMYGAVG
jgi:hypothetical protein